MVNFILAFNTLTAKSSSLAVSLDRYMCLMLQVVCMYTIQSLLRDPSQTSVLEGLNLLL